MRSTGRDRYDILSVHFFCAWPLCVADNFTVNFTEMLAHAHAKGTRPLFPLPWPGYEASGRSARVPRGIGVLELRSASNLYQSVA